MPSPTPLPRVLLATCGSGGDLEPFILMARALQARGHHVCLLSSREHGPRLAATGLPHRLFGTVEQIEAVLDNPALWDERQGLGVIWQSALPGMDELIEVWTDLAAAGPCVALCHPFMLPPAAIVRQRCPQLGLKGLMGPMGLVGVWLAPSNLRSLHDPLTMGVLRIPRWLPMAARRALWALADRLWIDGVVLPGLNAVRARHGLGPVAGFFSHLAGSCDTSLGLFPAWFAHRAPDWPRPWHEAGFPLRPAAAGTPALPADIEAFLAAGSPPVLVTFGTGMRHAAAAFGHCQRALQALGRRGLFVSPHRTQIPDDLPPGILWVARAPFEALLPRMAAIVHHGGIGTTAEALRAGLPQLVMPHGFDQFDNGERLRGRGVAQVLPARRATAARVQARLAALLASPAVALACREAAGLLSPAGSGPAWVDAVAAAVMGADAAARHAAPAQA